ncbi:PREDICTED: LOW QUALITY PROTEIN: uncharacterized protein LOC104478290 [Chlamydotis macqueenii]|uniref:LOW QUALITY PROTEIN: uncharacterized protein LOC104478290 n=1 Tax=Chlamydotis macqueenii TaxID=187382 RepID=UPI00052A10E1|nr:PREDICTED: LOW QUALITY PROTEIN: uncharacterized protein LOC104478290 [Chlamydotis macqueenii]
MAEKVGDQHPLFVRNRDSLYELLAQHGARPSQPGQDWARHNWADLQSVVHRVTSLREEARVKSGRGKAIVCTVLGASLVAAVEDRLQRREQEQQIIESLQRLVGALQGTISNLQEQLEEEKEKNLLLKAVLREECLKNSEPLSETDLKAEESGVGQMGPIAAELAELKREYGRLAKESETEYVWRVSLSGGDHAPLSEREAEGFWGPGVSLTTGDNRAPWSLTQRAAYWAGGLNPLERGDPPAITGTVDQLVESVQKAACLQMMKKERKLTPGCESPMMLPVDPESMTPLIRGLPEPLKSMGILLQKTIEAFGPLERLEGFVRGPKAWTWGEVARELINYGRKYGPVKLPEDRPKGTHQGGIRDSPPPVRQSGPCLKTAGGGQPRTRQQWWLLGVRKGVPRDVMDGLPLEKLSKVVSKWSNPKRYPPKGKENSPTAPAAAPSGDTGDRNSGIFSQKQEKQTESAPRG